MINFHENMWVENIERRNVVTPTEYLLLGSSLRKKVILSRNQNEYFEQKKQRERDVVEGTKDWIISSKPFFLTISKKPANIPV